jgi:hypothetical protein
VIGTKKLGTIRQELRLALTATGDDPIAWLERRMNAPEHSGSATDKESEILRSLQRFLEATPRERVRKARSGSKSRRSPR